MNKDFVISNLKDAAEEILNLVEDIESEEEYYSNVLYLSLKGIYEHLNMSWNARNATESEIEESSNKNFKKWVQFPKDIDMAEFLD